MNDDFDDMDMSIGDMQTMQEAKAEVLAYVDRYELTDTLGRGGFGMVFLATDKVTGQQVALKTLPPELNHSPDELEQVRENFTLVSNLHHQNIAAMKHLHKVERSLAGSQNVHIATGEYLMVMEYVQGSTLSNWKKQFPDRKVPFDQALDICLQVASALDYAHENKIIHRDIKPDNIMLDANAKVKVLDFGLAAEVRSSMSRVSTDTGSSSGTRPYMAPEQLNGKKQDHRADQYALAAMFYELISGAVPFRSVFETADIMLITKVVSDNEVEALEELDKKQNAVLAKALGKEREGRYETCSDFLNAFSGKVAQGSSSKGKLFAVLGLVALVLVGFLVFKKQEKLAAEEKMRANAEKARLELEARKASYMADRLDAAKLDLKKTSSEARIETPVNQVDIKESVEPRLDFKTNVPAMIFRGDEYLGNTPLLLTLEKGESYFFLAKSEGYETVSFNLKADFSGTRQKRIALAKTKAELYRSIKNARKSSTYGLADGSKAAQKLQIEQAKAEKKALEIELRQTKIRLRFIPKGSFMMGSNEGKIDEKPVHKVTLTESFYMGKFEVSQKEWQEVMGVAKTSNSATSRASDLDCPVTQVTWKDAQAFLRKLERIEGLPGDSLTLATEAQWEYATRAGTKTPHYTGNSLSAAQATGWTYSNSGKTTVSDKSWSKRAAKNMKCKTQVSGQKKANAFGLYDVYGNVWEWCQNWYGSYPKTASVDPLGPETGSFRVLRGGSCLMPVSQSRSSIRNWYPANYSAKDIGFRIVLKIQK